MAAVPQFGGLCSGMAVAFNTTTYAPLVGARGNTAANVTETSRQITWRTATTLSLFTVSVDANTIATSATTIRTRKNAGNGGQSVSYAAGVTGIVQDASGSDSVTAGDKMNVQIVTPNTSGSITIQGVETVSAAGSNTSVRYSTRNAITMNANNSSIFFCLTGSRDETVEAGRQVKSKATGTLKNLFTNISSNARTTTTTLRVRKNTANGTGAVSIIAGATGILEDVSGTDSVSVGDLINVALVFGASAENLVCAIPSAIDFETTNGTALVIQSSRSSAIAASSTVYMSIGGDGSFTPYATEASALFNALVGGVYSGLNCYMDTNTIVGASTLRFRKNSGSGTQAVSVTGLATGYFEDASGIDIVVPADTIDLQAVMGAAGTSAGFANTSLLFTAYSTAVGASTLTFSAAGVGASIVAAVGASTVAFSATAGSQVQANSVGVSSVIFTSTGVGSSLVSAVGDSMLVFTPTGVGALLASSVGSSSISFTPTGAGATQLNSAGSSTITFLASAVAASAGSVGDSSVSFSATGISQVLAGSVGLASIAFSATAVSISLSVGSASMAFSASGDSQVRLSSEGLSTITFIGLAASRASVASVGVSSISFTVTANAQKLVMNLVISGIVTTALLDANISIINALEGQVQIDS